MNRAHLHLTLREMRRAFSHRVTLAALAGVALIAGMSGPFGTLEALPLLARLGYWALVVPATYAAGYFGSALVHPALPLSPLALRIALAALGSALPVALLLGALNAGLGFDLGGLRSQALGLGAVYVICVIIEALGAVMQRAPPAPQQTAAAPALLDRLPLHKRGDLLAISAEDHYITVTTTLGQTMLLMRLADAMPMAAPVAGLQIHRSHWVALGAVVRAVRLGDGGEVVLASGAHLPIARGRMAAAQAFGLLPRKGGS